MSRPLAVLDANVLYPFQIRNLLLHIAEFGAFDPLWSETIVSEFSRHLLGSGAVTEDQLKYLVSQMRRYFPDAWGRNYEGRADHLNLPDEDDRHVVALAIHYEADYIVTQNTRDFPESEIAPYGIVAVTVDQFIGDLAHADRSLIVRAAEAHRCSLTKHPLSPADYLEALGRVPELTQTTALFREAGFLELDRPVIAEPGS